MSDAAGSVRLDKIPITHAVVAERVGKAYGKFRLRPRNTNAPERFALRDVSFTLNEGETLGLLGPNGAGKTTLLKIISTLLYPTTGRVMVFGKDIAKDSIEVRRNMGVVTSDERSFYWRLTGRQNLRFFAALYGVPIRKAEQNMEMLLDILGLTTAGDRLFHEYSSGMKQKLAIARGLLNEPRIVLYDEPTRALDPLSTQQIRGWIRKNRSRLPNQTHLLATNLLQEAEQLCDRVIIINHGTVIAFGTIDEIRENWRRHDYAIHHITWQGGALNGQLRPHPEIGILDIAAEYTGPDLWNLRLRSLKQSEALHQVLALVVDSGGKILRCDSQQISFDDIFCDLVTGHQEAPAVHSTGQSS